MHYGASILLPYFFIVKMQYLYISLFKKHITYFLTFHYFHTDEL